MKITLEEYLSLFTDSITKKDYDAIIKKIDARFDEIIRGNSIYFGWWDYSNESEDRRGCFKPDCYREDAKIEFHGEFGLPEPFDCGIPVRWLWEDYEDEFKTSVSNFLKEKKEREEKVKAKRETNKKERLNRIAQIKSKLTPQELSWITFK